MVVLLCPSPRLAAVDVGSDTLPAFALAPRSAVDTTVMHAQCAPARLMSPIRLSKTPGRNPLSIPRSTPPCSPMLIRRRPPVHASRTIRRQRHCPRHDCPMEPAVPAFETLPWISLLDAPNDGQNQDIADLSLLDEAPVPRSTGPVRRRKTSLRSSPMAVTLELEFDSDNSSDSGLDDASAPVPALLRGCPLSAHSVPESQPQTPHSVFDPSMVQFRSLMPVVSGDGLNA